MCHILSHIPCSKFQRVMNHAVNLAAIQIIWELLPHSEKADNSHLTIKSFISNLFNPLILLIVENFVIAAKSLSDYFSPA